MILSGFYNKRKGSQLRLSVARKAIRSFERASGDKGTLIDLMLFFA